MKKKFYQDIHNDYDYVYQSKAALTASINLMEKSMKEEFMFIQSHTKKIFKVFKKKKKTTTT